MDRPMGRYTEGQTNGQVDTDGLTNGQVDTDGQTDQQADTLSTGG